MTAKTISRRDFLKRSAAGAGAAALAATSTACAASPDKTGKLEIETPSYQYGAGDTSSRILVAYATRTGSTVGVASAIGEVLAARGFAVDVKPIRDAPSLDGYQAVILGSAINGGRWLPEATAYVQDHQQALSALPVALFCVHIMNLGDDEKAEKNRRAYLNPIREMVQPIDEAYFAGMGMNPDEEPAIVRWFYRTFEIGGEGDCRDWEKIRSWAEGARVEK